MDTLVCNAQPVKSQMDLDNNATKLQSVSVQEKFLELFQTATNAEFAQIDHNNLYQMPAEEDVLDQFQSVDVPKDTLLTVMNAFLAQKEVLETQVSQTARDASDNNATKETRSSHQETTASDVMFAQMAMNQTQQRLNASESSQNAAALKFMTQLDTSVFHADNGKLLPTTTRSASIDNALDQMRSLVPLNHAMHANNAIRDLPQITSEEDVLDLSSHNAHVTRDSTKLVSDVLGAQWELDHQLTTEAVLMFNVTKIKSSEMTCFAHNANGAHQELFQTHKEESVSSSQDQPSTLTEHQNVMNSQSSTWIELSVSSAPTT